MPGTESSEFNIELKMPQGTRLERTASTTAKIESVINELLGDKIRLIYAHSGITTTTGGDNSDLFRDENTSIIKVFLKDEYLHLSGSAITLIEENIASIPELEASFSREESALSSTLESGEAPFVF